MSIGNLSEQLSGTAKVLEEAANEIVALKRRIAACEEQNHELRAALSKIRLEVNTTIDKTVGTNIRTHP